MSDFSSQLSHIENILSKLVVEKTKKIDCEVGKCPNATIICDNVHRICSDVTDLQNALEVKLSAAEGEAASAKEKLVDQQQKSEEKIEKMTIEFKDKLASFELIHNASNERIAQLLSQVSQKDKLLGDKSCEIIKLEDELNELKKKLDEKDEHIDGIKDEHATNYTLVYEELERHKVELDEVAGKHSVYENQIAETKAKHYNLSKQIDDLNKQIDDLKEALRKKDLESTLGASKAAADVKNLQKKLADALANLKDKETEHMKLHDDFVHSKFGNEFEFHRLTKLTADQSLEIARLKGQVTELKEQLKHTDVKLQQVEDHKTKLESKLMPPSISGVVSYVEKKVAPPPPKPILAKSTAPAGISESVSQSVPVSSAPTASYQKKLDVPEEEIIIPAQGAKEMKLNAPAELKIDLPAEEVKSPLRPIPSISGIIRLITPEERADLEEDVNEIDVGVKADVPVIPTKKV